jgi:cytidylate kinase
VVRIVTIEREYGCGASEIAEKLAARLDWKLGEQLVPEQIARLAHCDHSVVAEREERRDPLYRRLMQSFALGSYEGSGGVYPIESLDADSIVRLSERVVNEAAAQGNCVIVGRGSQHFLATREDTLRFFLYAPKENKVRRLISEGTPEAKANLLVDTIDRERRAFIKRYFHAEWPNFPLYHAMINTAVGEEQVIKVMMSFCKRNYPVDHEDQSTLQPSNATHRHS